MVRAEYKHLKPDEKEIARRFVEGGYLTGEYQYDVILESPDIVFPPTWTKKDFEHWGALRAKRIDLVVNSTKEIWIIEITPKLSKTAIGGVLTYKQMYDKQFKFEKPSRCGIVVEVDDLAYHPTLEQFRITLWVV